MQQYLPIHASVILDLVLTYVKSPNFTLYRLVSEYNVLYNPNVHSKKEALRRI